MKRNLEIIQNYHIFSGCDGTNASTNPNIINQKRYGGVAIIIKNTLVPYVKSIRCINERIMDIRIKNRNGKKDITIVTSYVLRLWYGTSKIEARWNNLNRHTYSMSGNNRIVWLSDNNGQISKNDENNEWVGPWTYRNITGEGNGDNFVNTCLGDNIKCLNTTFPPKTNMGT